jgi:hypothetical protein
VRRIRSNLSYANVVASIALFVAVGGTGYAAITLPRDSVGSEQIRARAVGAPELRSRAVNSRVIRNRSIRLVDVAVGTRESLRGQQGPAGPPGAPAVSFRAAISSGGGMAIGNAHTVTHVSGSNQYRVDFGHALARCTFSATLAAVQDGPVLEQPEAGRITVAAEGERVLVRTFGATGAASEQPFHLAVFC